MPIAFAKLIAGLDITSPFVGAWELERRRGRPYKARLGANECLFGASPAAMAVLTARGPETALYCDPTHTELRDAIALAFGLSRRHVVVAEGIEGLLGLFTRALLDPGDVAVTSQGGYPSFDFYVRGCGGKLVHIPYLSSGKNDLEGLIDAARRHRAKLVYLANPDNPTGSNIGSQDLRRALDRLPGETLLLLDEAYAELAAPDEQLPKDEIRPGLVRLRTFSKIYGLAGARVGYAVADPAILGPLERIRQHFAVSKLSQEMALAAIEDHEFVESVLAQTAQGREHYAAIAARIGAKTLPSSASFVAFDFGDAERAKLVAGWLEDHDIFVRRVPDPPLDRLVRITVGPPEARAYLTEVLIRAAEAAERAGK
ncbi:MAG: aminotransferase class I/II-fold pyridoxal phosphate-dependent enzyme [Polyangiaceae bacterium]|nr:aminotransferase class I/II-fold pyridoxal phosphate-dependent enzyme [Polyangiaceae bacterium]